MDKLKIFISSTQTDLQNERDTVNSIVGLLGHDCLRAETYCAPGMSPLDACKRMAQECDIYIGIFGPKYGTVPSGLGTSVTEMEYDIARECDPNKIIIYVKISHNIDTQQQSFLNKVQEFSNGYFRHAKFSNINVLKEYVRQDFITWTTRQVRASLASKLEIMALLDKVAHQSRVMNIYGIPKELQ